MCPLAISFFRSVFLGLDPSFNVIRQESVAGVFVNLFKVRARTRPTGPCIYDLTLSGTAYALTAAD